MMDDISQETSFLLTIHALNHTILRPKESVNELRCFVLLSLYFSKLFKLYTSEYYLYDQK